MFVHSVKLFNFKSFNDVFNELILERGTTTIIGKNESGKTNILEGLSYISNLNFNNEVFSQTNINRNVGFNDEIYCEVILKPRQNLGIKLSNGEETKIILYDKYSRVTGSIIELFNVECKTSFSNLSLLLEDQKFGLTGESLVKHKQLKNCLISDKHIDFYEINSLFKFLDIRMSAQAFAETELKEVFIESKENWALITSKLPQVYFSEKDKQLKTRYTHQEVLDELKHPTKNKESLLSNLVDLIEMNAEEFSNAVKSGDNPRQLTARDKVRSQIHKNINIDFANFYKTENIVLSVEFGTNSINFTIKSNAGMALSLNERSNGLRWYLNLFIDSRSKGIDNSNVLYLFDEPGITLHVDAQKELLTLFNDLVNKGNQIAFTTHIPFMIDVKNNMRAIRPVIKTAQGNSKIFKTAYDHRITEQGYQETLTPVIKAIGLSLGDFFGPSQSRLNIITEGVSDYIYLTSIFKHLELDVDKYNFIPSFGVTSSVNICNILEGWGCKFLAIYDFDKEGVEKGGNKLKNSQLYEYNEDFIYIKDISQDSIEKSEYIQKPIVIEDLIESDEFRVFRNEVNIKGDNKMGKTLLAKKFTDDLSQNKFELSKEVEENFNIIFAKIEKIYRLKIEDSDGE